MSLLVDDSANALGGLGNGDSARVFLADGTTLVDEHAYPAHGTPSWGRCPDTEGVTVGCPPRPGRHGARSSERSPAMTS